MTITDLQRLHESGYFNITEIARHAGIEPATLLARLRRGSPELTVNESERIEALLRGLNLDFGSSNQSDLVASVQYNDAKGTAAADWQMFMTELHDLAEELGIDTDKYHPVAFRLALTEMHPGDFDAGEEGYANIYAVDTDVVGKEYNEVMRYYFNHGHVLPCIEFSLNISALDVIRRLKRLDIVLQQGYRGVSNYEIRERRDLD